MFVVRCFDDKTCQDVFFNDIEKARYYAACQRRLCDSVFVKDVEKGYILEVFFKDDYLFSKDDEE